MRTREPISGAPCFRCQEFIHEGTTVCACGAPTPFMSFDERREHEAEQWRSYKARAAS